MTAVANALRNLDLSRLTADDLENVSSLVAYWDTLGWVQFQKGNIDLAERYISAAWSIGQHSEVGYHLGQIYEKRGKNEAAIHLYALASVADRSVPEPRESLFKLAGQVKAEALLKSASVEYRESRTLKLGPAQQDVKGSTEARFFVVLAPGAARNAQVTDVKFISGDSKLRPLAAALRGANFNFVFPDETATKVIRRGTLFCQPSGQCSFVMLSPEHVTLVE